MNSLWQTRHDDRLHKLLLFVVSKRLCSSNSNFLKATIILGHHLKTWIITTPYRPILGLDFYLLIMSYTGWPRFFVFINHIW